MSSKNRLFYGRPTPPTQIRLNGENRYWAQLGSWQQKMQKTEKEKSQGISDLTSRLNLDSKTPFLIGVAGGTASGKSTVCKRIMEKLGQNEKDSNDRQVICISQDSFYRDLTDEEKLQAQKGQFNFDHPDAFDDELMLYTLQEILAGKKCDIRAYDYKTNSIQKDKIITIHPVDVVLFEGILSFYFPKIRDLFHMKLFVDTDSDTRLARRVPRDINEYGRSLDQVLNQYISFVKPAFDDFCFPTKKFADVIIPRGADNLVAIELIVQHIQDYLDRVRFLTSQLKSDLKQNSQKCLHRTVSKQSDDPQCARNLH